MESLHQLRNEQVLNCRYKQLSQSSLQQDNRMPHRTQRVCYWSWSSSTRTPFYQQAMWLAALMCCCFSVTLAQAHTIEVTDSVVSTTATNLDVTTYDGTYTPTQATSHTLEVTDDALSTTVTSLDVTTYDGTYIPTLATFNYVECRNSMDTNEQISYICQQNPQLFYILKFAESLAKRKCEAEFKHELWNCSGFSILREPKLTKSENMFKESAYMYSISLAAIAHTVAQACSGQVVSGCGCEAGETGCLDNVNNALKVAETFLNKRYGRQGKTLNIELIHHNLAAAKQNIHHLINTSAIDCKCHGVSGSCSLRTCLPEFPSFNQIATALKNAYDNACHVLPNGQSRNVWLSNCGRNYTDRDLLFRDNFDWCNHRPSVGSLGTAGRECSTTSGSSNSCEKLCSHCGRGHTEHYMERERKCDCEFRFCCEIHCNICNDRRTIYSCSSS